MVRGEILQRVKKTEKALFESEEKFRYVFENSCIGKSLTLPSGEVQSNNILCELLGYSKEELKWKKWQELTHPDDIDDSQRELDKIISGDQASVAFCKRYIKKDGSILWADVHTSVRRDTDGIPLHYITSVIDITDRKKEQEKLTVSEIRYRRLFESAKDGILILDADTGKINDVNPYLINMLGYSKEELLEKNIWEIGSFKDIVANRENFLKLQSNGYIRYENMPLRNEKGQQIEVEFVSNVYSADNKNVIQCNIRDITERKRMEAEINRERDMAKLYFDTAGVMFVAISSDKTVMAINKRGCEVLGASEKDIIGKKWIGNFIPKSSAADVKNVFNKIINGELENVRFFENPVVTASGEERLISWHNAILRDEVGTIIGLLASGNDVTEAKKAELTIKHLASFPELNPNPIVELTQDGSINYANPAAKNLFPDLELYGDRHPFMKNCQFFIRLLLDQQANTLEQEIMIGDRFYSQTFQYLETTKTIRVYSQEITERKKSEEALKRSEKKYSSYIENAPDGVFVTDETGKYLEVNRAASEITGYSKDELFNMTISDIITPETLKDGMNHFKRLLEQGASSGSMQFKHKDGSNRWWSVDAVKLTDNRYLGFVKDITDREKAENELVHLSYHDQLTGLYNRRFFEEELRRLDTKRNLPLSIIMGDINGLKLVNDSFGHAAGDEYLKKTAEIIKIACRADDIVARLGGDEFVVLLPKANASEALKIVNRIERILSRKNFGKIGLSVSFGVDTKANEKQSVLEILANAENHMYRHKIFEHLSVRSKTIDIIMNTLFEKSSRESLHSKRVSVICGAIASKMNFSKDDMNQIKTAGLVHDIGKIGIDEKILNKKGSLNDSEWREIQKHPEAGWRILKTTAEFSEMAEFVLHHHERYDGSGYPNGTKGEEIPIEARIITLADSYDAMTSKRTYKIAMEVEEAIKEIKENSGKQFDPKIVDVFINKVLPDNSKTSEDII